MSLSPSIRGRSESVVGPEGYKKTKRALITCNKEGVIVSCNNAARFLWGFPLGQMVGARVERLMPAAIAARHQGYIDAHVASGGVTTQSFGAWKVREALGFKGDRFMVRISLSKSTVAGEPTFSALVEPFYECTLTTDDSGTISRAEGSPSLLFGVAGEELVGKPVYNLLENGGAWKVSPEKVIICRNADGEDFVARLAVKKEGALLVGRFSEAPHLKMRLTINEAGCITECSGDCYVFVGYKPKSLRGMQLGKLMSEEDIASVSLDTKSVVSLRCKNGIVAFATLRVTKVRLPDGSVCYEGSFKSAQAGDGKSVLKGEKLRYDGPVFGWYELGPSLGHGMCGPVRRAVHRLTGEEVAIKTLARQRYRELNMVYPPQELRLLERVRHPNLVRMLDTIWDGDNIYMVMELISGGEFFEFCVAAGALTEPQAQGFWRQLVSGVDYLHRGGISHRDIKLENLVLDSNYNLKLVDFGFATSFYNGEKLKVFCGSPDYAAPELVGMTEYEGPKVDLWAMGVCLYIMLTGYIPFSSPASILSYKLQFPGQQQLSAAAQALLKAIFRPPETRATMDMIVVHEWTNAGCPDPVRRMEACLQQPTHEIHEDIIAAMEDNYGWTREAIQAALAAHQVSSQLATTYNLLDNKKHRLVAPKNPIWKGGKKKTSQQQACNLQ